VLNQFPTLEDIARTSNAELEDVAGIGKSNAKQQKSWAICPAKSPLVVSRLYRLRLPHFGKKRGCRRIRGSV
jgi:hypothetical protein